MDTVYSCFAQCTFFKYPVFVFTCTVLDVSHLLHSYITTCYLFPVCFASRRFLASHSASLWHCMISFRYFLHTGISSASVLLLLCMHFLRFGASNDVLFVVDKGFACVGAI
jgi:hypothetical protein